MPARWDGDGSPEPPLDPRGLGTLVHAVLAEIDFARPGDVAELVRRLADEHLPQAEGPPGRADRDDRAVPRLAAGRGDRRGERSRIGSWSSCWPGRPCETASGAAPDTLPARLHRLPLPRRRRPVAAGRLQDQSRDGGDAGRDGGGVRNADVGLCLGRRDDPWNRRRRN